MNIMNFAPNSWFHRKIHANKLSTTEVPISQYTKISFFT